MNKSNIFRNSEETTTISELNHMKQEQKLYNFPNSPSISRSSPKNKHARVESRETQIRIKVTNIASKTM